MRAPARVLFPVGLPPASALVAAIEGAGDYHALPAHALDAETGQPCTDFGVNGRIDMSEHAGGAGDWFGHHGVTSPPAVAATKSSVSGSTSIPRPRNCGRNWACSTGFSMRSRSAADALRSECRELRR